MADIEIGDVAPDETHVGLWGLLSDIGAHVPRVRDAFWRVPHDEADRRLAAFWAMVDEARVAAETWQRERGPSPEAASHA